MCIRDSPYADNNPVSLIDVTGEAAGYPDNEAENLKVGEYGVYENRTSIKRNGERLKIYFYRAKDKGTPRDYIESREQPNGTYNII